MANAERDLGEWRDGFLLVGNHAALDLLNTRLVNAEGPVELLADVDSLARWLVASGTVRDAAAIAAVRAWGESKAAREFLRELLTFRESLRVAVARFAAGRVPEQFLGGLNERLLSYPQRYLLRRSGSVIERKTYLELRKPEELWSEMAGAAADLFTEVPFARVRRCEGCVVNFYDISKKGSRRWCSMSLCGNRDKVASYRRRLSERVGSAS